MPALKDIGNIQNLLQNSPLSTSKLWFTDVENIHPVQIIAFIQRMKHEGYELEATHNVELALNEIMRAVVRGEIRANRLARMRLPQKPVTLGDVKRMLSNFSLIRRKAILFALEADMQLEDVVLLRWKYCKVENFDGPAGELIRSLPRHITCDFVFWEYNRNAIGTPLFGLVDQFNDLACKLSWDDFKQLYARAVPYDYDLEAAAFETSLRDLFK